jgi:small subunit ribosomal protein S11
MADKNKKDSSRKRAKRRSISEGSVHIHASKNNTIVTFTDNDGNAVGWSAAGASGFRGSRKSTPYAAQVAAENAAEKVKNMGFERAHVFVKGIGVGRDQALRALSSKGIDILSITDRTGVAFGGCRAEKPRRN